MRGRVHKLVEVFGSLSPRWLFLLAYGTNACIRNIYNLLIGYGNAQSAFFWRSCTTDKAPVPWFSYPAIEYIQGLDLSEMTVFEFGSGYSSVYWGRWAKSLTSVEVNQEWKERIDPLLSQTARIILCSKEKYPESIDNTSDNYDIIVIDAQQRLECAKHAVSRLKAGGFIILDDANLHADAAAFLRDHGLIEIDFAGFAPINSYTKTTSLFLHPEFRPSPRNNALPVRSLCFRES